MGDTVRPTAATARNSATEFAQKIAAAVREPLIVLDRELRVVFANPAFYAGFDVRPDEAEGRLIYQLGGDQWDIPELHRLLEEVLPHDEQFSDVRVEHEFERIGRRVMMLNGRRFDDEQLILLAVEDRTHREAAVGVTAAARGGALSSDFRALFEASPTPFLVVAPPDWTVVAANEAFLHASMLRRETLLGRALFDLFPDDPADPEATGVGNLTASLNRVAATGTTDVMAVQRYPIRSREGRFEERWWSPVNSPVLGPDGELALVIHRVEDVTETVRRRGEHEAQDQLVRSQEEVIARLRDSEAALRDSEARYRTLFESIDQGFCVIEMILDERDQPADYRFLEVNPAFERQTGLRDALGRRMRELAPGHEQHWFDIYGDVALTGRSQRFENRAEALNGRWYDVYAIRVGEPEQRRVAVLFNDLTERKRAEDALRQSEERYRAIVEEAVDYAIFTTDARNRIETWPPGAQAVFGWSPEEAIGQRADITFTPEDRAAAQPAEEFETARESGFAPDVRWHERKDGGRVFIEGSSRPRRSADGAFQGLLKIGRDVTERHRVVEALRASEERFRQFADAATDVLWVRDAETLTMEYLNPAFDRVYGTSRDAVLGRGPEAWSELLHPHDRDHALAAIERVRGGERVSHEFRVLRPEDQAICWVRDTDFPLRGADGRVQRIAGFAADITHQKRAQEHERMLVAELQHRVRNILAVTRSVARRSSASSDTVEDYATHLDGRINALARTQAVLTRRPGEGVALESLVADELLAYAVSDAQISLSGPEVRLQPKAAETLGLAVHELATNAVKYGALSTERGHVAVTWTVTPDSDVPLLKLDWRETGVSIVSSGPRRRGFGQELIERTVPYELEARAELVFEPGGVCCRIDMPMNQRNVVAEGEIARGADLMRQPAEGKTVDRTGWS